MLKDLLLESSGASAIQAGRPTLTGLTRKVTSLLYTDLVGIQETKSPLATVFGVRYDLQSQDGNRWIDAQLNHKVGSGQFHFGDTGLSGPTATMSVGDYFLVSDYVFEVIVAGDYSTVTDVKTAFSKVFTGALRPVADGIPAGGQQDGTEVIQESRFILNRWQAEVRSRKLKCPITIESLQDMEAMGMDGQGMVEDMIASAMAEDINSDIIMRLITVSSKMPALDLSKVETYYKGRYLLERAAEMYGKIKSTTTFDPTFLLCSSTVGAILMGGGQVDNDMTIRGTGMKLYLDNDAEMEYMVVGARYKLEDETYSCAAPVFFSPFINEDGVGTFLVTRDVKNLQPVLGLISRYAISAPPTSSAMAPGAAVASGENWQLAANKSEFAWACEIVL